MKAQLILKEPIGGYWDGGKKDVFNIELGTIQHDSKGFYRRVDIWDANYYFYIGCGIKKPSADKTTLLKVANRLKKSHKGNVQEFKLIEEVTQ